jgi:antitoxin (DNA-binding transcriptional repressor) of toxin-antitoxin stability system
VVRLSATEVSRNFSSVIDRVNAGEEIEIVRNGTPIAELRRPSRPQGISTVALRELLEGLPPVDEDFARDVEEASRTIWPDLDKWPAS